MVYFSIAIYLCGYALMIRHSAEVEKNHLFKSRRWMVILACIFWPFVAVMMAVVDLFLWLSGSCNEN